MPKVTFDGVNKQIVVNAMETEIEVKADIYSAWKDWVMLSDNSKYEEAIRTIGGDPIGGALFAGDLYFLMNDWTVVIGHEVDVTGALFNDEPGSPFTVSAGGRVTSTVSNLVQTVATGASVPALTEQQIADIVEAVWNSNKALTAPKYLALQK